MVDPATINDPSQSPRVGIATLVGYLSGRCDAILSIAAAPSAVWLGLLFVLSAGFAREYDGEDLLHEPWHLLIPLAASLGTSLLLYSLICFIGWLRPLDEVPFRRLYPRFLSLYWLTAPLAWLYAIPVERFLGPAESTRANLYLLGIVSLWRVALMSRVVFVVFGTAPWAAVMLVMAFADAVMLTLLFNVRLPVFAIMGGIRLSESEQVIQSITMSVGAIGLLTAPVWLLGLVAAAGSRKSEWQLAAETKRRDGQVAVSAWTLAATSIAVWPFVLPITQPEQQLRRSVEDDLRAGRYEAALRTMSSHKRGNFPPHWDPPPRVGYGDRSPPLIEIIERIQTSQVAPWVEELFLEKFANDLRGPMWPYGRWFYLEGRQLERYVTAVERLPQRARSKILAEQESGLQFVLESIRHGEERPPVSEGLRERIAALLKEAEAARKQVEAAGEI